MEVIDRTLSGEKETFRVAPGKALASSGKQLI
jgi:hypothetical protein